VKITKEEVEYVAHLARLGILGDGNRKIYVSTE